MHEDHDSVLTIIFFAVILCHCGMTDDELELQANLTYMYNVVAPSCENMSQHIDADISMLQCM